jgi:hypothetical protein
MISPKGKGLSRRRRGGILNAMAKTDKMRVAGDVIESTAGEVGNDLARLGVDPARPVAVVLEPDDWLNRARAEMRKKVEAAGLSDAEIDDLIKEARREANTEMRNRTQ